MMTYSDLFKQFQYDIQQAVSSYQSLFEEDALPLHRAEDIALFYEALANAKDNQNLTQDIISTIQQLKTGWFIGEYNIYESGDSRLKDNLLAVLQQQNYSSHSFMQARINELEHEVARGNLMQDLPVSLSDETKGLEDALIKSKEDVLKLKGELQQHAALIKTLRQENKSLVRRNHALFEKNQRVREQLDSAAKGVRPNTDDDYLSPTDDINQVFDQFAQGF